jgi:hypothetical protein
MTYKCFITAKHQQALLVIMCFSMTLTAVNPHRGDYSLPLIYCNYCNHALFSSLTTFLRYRRKAFTAQPPPQSTSPSSQPATTTSSSQFTNIAR